MMIEQEQRERYAALDSDLTLQLRQLYGVPDDKEVIDALRIIARKGHADVAVRLFVAAIDELADQRDAARAEAQKLSAHLSEINAALTAYREHFVAAYVAASNGDTQAREAAQSGAVEALRLLRSLSGITITEQDVK